MDKQTLLNELIFKAVRSSGPGGQHANKVSSKVELNFDLEKSNALNEAEKTLLKKSLKNRLTTSGTLSLQCDDSRSQHQNKSLLVKRFLSLLEKGLEIPKSRKKTRPTKASVRKRLDTKKKQAEKKQQRQKPSSE
ncbi:alternative ribosome rescue aminoacyl-tRNA hydrolase ArfB [Lentiprolixibacter aurantiacus]|uniref:Alternative ribosome rescue aminoacyl-tRNA hydrolase ArfB n=1 Tax=Lentiprolixibacter aurantiacus TaxID=2993939 RepID=A0AAE3MIP8_9FLAO|nr:alternative ribosome rescue aminoacyl-tRNA hydrolase ArfB [Lentiprolixibacter aurantiacus]MCX2718415.1 alternative ribosome rescue aminoacyl-tRNA hydrolase ArfB [Lentiprolixibacter aurantiacus]